MTQESAEKLGQEDQKRLLKQKKLILLVDLDQTIIHTTNDPAASEGLDEGEYEEFQLDTLHRYYTKIRPFCQTFLHNVAKSFELHIVTFGSRKYAHKVCFCVCLCHCHPHTPASSLILNQIAEILDPQKQLFYHRILSRDECFSAHNKTANLKDLFPCGDSL